MTLILFINFYFVSYNQMHQLFKSNSRRMPTCMHFGQIHLANKYETRISFVFRLYIYIFCCFCFINISSSLNINYSTKIVYCCKILIDINMHTTILVRRVRRVSAVCCTLYAMCVYCAYMRLFIENIGG